jgi:hypothetical protein
MADADEPIRRRDHDSVPLGKVVVYCLAIVSTAAAVIHFAIASDHFQQFWLYSVYMIVVAWAQLAWAIAIAVRPSRPLLWSGAALGGAVLAGFIITGATGDAIGTAPPAAGLSGLGDGLTAVLEVLLIAGCAWVLTARLGRPVQRQRLILAPATAGVATAVLLSVALATAPTPAASAGSNSAAGHLSSGMHMSPGMAMPGTASSVKLATTTPAGDITVPDTNMQMMPGMRMASSKPCTAAPTTAQQKSAVSWVDASWKGAQKYQSLAAAKAAGYRPLTPSGARVVHYINVSAYLAVLSGGPVLNTAQPQSLVYANTPKGAVLVAAMYITSPHGPTPQPGGCLTQWHVHTNLCLSRGLQVVGTLGPGQPTCPAGSRNKVTPAMMHVWFVPIPGGPTAIDAPDPQIVHAAERVPAPRNGTA